MVARTLTASTLWIASHFVVQRHACNFLFYLLNTSFLKYFRSVSDVFFPHHCARLVPRAGAIQRRVSRITVDVITKKFVLVFRAHLGSQGLDGRETAIGYRTYKSHATAPQRQKHKKHARFFTIVSHEWSQGSKFLNNNIIACNLILKTMSLKLFWGNPKHKSFGRNYFSKSSTISLWFQMSSTSGVILLRKRIAILTEKGNRETWLHMITMEIWKSIKCDQKAGGKFDC